MRVFSPDTMVTALYGTLDPRSGVFEYAFAGHFPPAHLRPRIAASWSRCAPIRRSASVSSTSATR